MGKLICPICDTATAFWPYKFEGKITIRHADKSISYQDGLAEALTPSTYGNATYSIVLCQACEKLFVAEEKSSGWESVYPIQHKLAGEDILEPMKSDFDEASLCLAVGAYKGTLVMCQATMEALWRDKKATRLNDLKDGGIISEQLFLQATEIRLWAGIVKHEPLPDAVGKEDAEQLLTYLEGILDAVYVQPARFAALSQKRDQIKKGDKAA